MSLNQFIEQRRLLEQCTGTQSTAPLSIKEEICVAEQWPFKQIFVISIRQSRLLRCLKRLGRLSQYVTIIPACHGEYIDHAQWASSITPHCKLRRGQLGCMESHCRVWRYLVEHNVQQALVLEDDASLRPTAVVCRQLLRSQTDWQRHSSYDIVCLGRSDVKRLNGAIITQRLVVSGEFYGLFAYMITRVAALKLLRHPGVQRFSEPVDTLVSALGKEGYLQILACEPPVCEVIASTWSDTNQIR